MGSLFGGRRMPAPPPPPKPVQPREIIRYLPAPPPPVQAVRPQPQAAPQPMEQPKAEQEERMKTLARKRAGRKATIITGPQGDLTQLTTDNLLTPKLGGG